MNSNFNITPPLPWRHNGRDSVSSHQPHHCLLNGLFRRRKKTTSKLRVTGLCAGNCPHKWPVTRKIFPFDDVIMRRSHKMVPPDMEPNCRDDCDNGKLWSCGTYLNASMKWAIFGLDRGFVKHYNDVIMSAMASQITGVSTVCSYFCSGVDQRKH